jgi:hypothetical protein
MGGPNEFIKKWEKEGWSVSNVIWCSTAHGQGMPLLKIVFTKEVGGDVDTEQIQTPR